MMAADAAVLVSAPSPKTVNLPNERDGRGRARRSTRRAGRLGLKAVALYRDGCKASQPLSTVERRRQGSDEGEGEGLAEPLSSRRCHGHAAQDRARSSTLLASTAALRVRLPEEAQRLHAGGHASAATRSILRTGEYEDGTLGRDLHRHAQGGRRLPLADELLRHRASRIGLQYGVPLEDVRRPVHASPASSRRAPSRVTERQDRDLDRRLHLPRRSGIEYLGRYDLAHVKPEPTEAVDDGQRGHRPTPPSHRAGELAALASHGADRRGDRRPRARSRRRRSHAAPALPLDAQLDDMMGDAPVLRRLRPHRGPQRRLLQVPELRQLDGLLPERIFSVESTETKPLPFPGGFAVCPGQVLLQAATRRCFRRAPACSAATAEALPVAAYVQK
jgi:ribonucleoside-diphosphate reductase alpha chain